VTPARPAMGGGPAMGWRPSDVAARWRERDGRPARGAPVPRLRGGENSRARVAASWVPQVQRHWGD
jgi:hypothetical protein